MMRKKFPLVADDEQIAQEPIIMRLYNNEDLINNIHGPYQDKDFTDVTKDFNFVDQTPGVREKAPERLQTVNEGKSYAQKAKEEARRDIKEKRRTFLANETKVPAKPAFQRQSSSYVSQPKSSRRSDNELSRFSEKLHQETYILAELPRVYTEPDNSSRTKPQKNTYDFLKRSQIYNKQDLQTQREHQLAQELNLTRFAEMD
ncbi:hypothetical protein DDV21_002925 [Streptococcus chenjunshii]|uniref:Cystathionine gamma-synthase n=1 Tax=Streptococcus chenjunshii TaxID=2173853 RepID=A0A372KLW1_9STRE|nr:hypothetical protein [Streptococcus chenjunshii]AXQ78102.1 hypothetical protein DDV21_002925 [Streptococcus chenjunshii]RFU51197.1 hypothetical protein DDV22_04875 [Streptococcus chenjunshii]RFU53263.1 hypothetical protein DDV23_05230 [Streptococcus chenjunshii]